MNGRSSSELIGKHLLCASNRSKWCTMSVVFGRNHERMSRQKISRPRTWDLERVTLPVLDATVYYIEYLSKSTCLSARRTLIPSMLLHHPVHSLACIPPFHSFFFVPPDSPSTLFRSSPPYQDLVSCPASLSEPELSLEVSLSPDPDPLPFSPESGLSGSNMLLPV